MSFLFHMLLAAPRAYRLAREHGLTRRRSLSVAFFRIKSPKRSYRYREPQRAPSEFLLRLLDALASPAASKPDHAAHRRAR